MIGSLHIRNFKNLVDLNIPKLSRINLISGKNNVGKTSLLEALRLYISDAQLPDILNGRGEIVGPSYKATDEETSKNNYIALSSLFTDRNKEIGPDNVITINGEAGDVSARFFFYTIQSYESDGRLFQRMSTISNPKEHSDQELSIGFEIIRNGELAVRHPLDRKLNFLKNYPIERKSKIADNLTCVNYNFDNAEFTSKLWDAITLTDKEDEVIKALQIIEPNVENLAFLEDPYSRNRYPVVKIKGLGGRAPLKSMGDGINHILAIVLSIVNSENGCVIIDEIDNGLHYTVQKQLWSVIFDLSKKLNVQIFATTHSSDCISSFSKVLQQTGNREEGSFIRLEMKNGHIVSTEYNPDELEIVASQNIEIR